MTLRRTHLRRIDRLREAIGSAPIPPGAVDEGFDLFCRTGRLPGMQGLAAAITERALYRRADGSNSEDMATRRTRIIRFMEAKRRGEVYEPPGIRLREFLFDEAVYGPDFVRRVARIALRREVRNGADVTDPDYLEDRPHPVYGTVGLNVLGIYEKLSAPPHQERAVEVFAEYSALHQGRGLATADWAGDVEEAVTAFQERGDLPVTRELEDAVLVDLELHALIWHARGLETSKLLMCIDYAKEPDCPRRGDALAAMRQLIRQGLRRRSET